MRRVKKLDVVQVRRFCGRSGAAQQKSLEPGELVRKDRGIEKWKICSGSTCGQSWELCL